MSKVVRSVSGSAFQVVPASFIVCCSGIIVVRLGLTDMFYKNGKEV